MPAQHVAGTGKKGWPKIGQRVSVRVLECDAGSRRLTLTMKRLLLEEKLAPFASWEVCPLFGAPTHHQTFPVQGRHCKALQMATMALFSSFPSRDLSCFCLEHQLSVMAQTKHLAVAPS